MTTEHTPTEAPDYSAAIDRGIALLDKTYGRQGWLPFINIDRLDLGEGDFYPTQVGSCGCVLAQLDAAPEEDHGDYAMLARRLGLETHYQHALKMPPEETIYGHGFSVDAALFAHVRAESGFEGAAQLFEPLTAQWKAKLLALKEDA